MTSRVTAIIALYTHRICSSSRGFLILSFRLVWMDSADSFSRRKFSPGGAMSKSHNEQTRNSGRGLLHSAGVTRPATPDRIQVLRRFPEDLIGLFAMNARQDMDWRDQGSPQKNLGHPLPPVGRASALQRLQNPNI